jgi:hypothetical protein
LSFTSGAESGAVGAQSGASEPDLQQIIDAWHDLPDAVRASILAMINAS